MHLKEKTGTPLYSQLKRLFTAKIKNNEWAVNVKIPTERELCNIYNVSRITVRQALDELEKEGYLYRRQGKGTFVTAPKLVQRLSKFYSFSEDIKNMGYCPSTKILDFCVLNSGSKISGYLGVDEGCEVYSIKRLRLADNEPFAIETSYIPVAICPGMTAQTIASAGLYNTLINKYNIIPDEAEETFEAVLIKGDNALHLNTSKNSAAIHLERITRASDTIVEYCDCLIRGDRYKYKVLLK